VPAAQPLPRDQLTLGLLAGGQATRLQGMDKAWMRLRNRPQASRWMELLRDQVAACIASANRDLDRYAQIGIAAFPDEVPGRGPIEGLRMLALHCRTAWLFSLPVDIAGLPTEVLPALAAGSASGNGAFLLDDDGPQPLVAIWRRDVLLAAANDAVRERDLSVQSLARRIGMLELRLQDVRLGNINTPEDLQVARIASR
jgi:molybdopterin-guanine dinucleotide biosynthesis protein A